MKVETTQVSTSETSDLKNTAPKNDETANVEILDTWVFEGNVYKAPEYEMPKPLEAAFKPFQGTPAQNPPYVYDASKFQVFFQTTEREEGEWEDAGVVNLHKVGDIAGVTAEGGMQYKIELHNAQHGKFPVTKEEMLKAVHAAKLELGLPDEESEK